MKSLIFQPVRAACGFALGLGLTAAMAFSATTANADVLEQKWEAGQQLSYDLKMDGTLRLTAPDQIPMIGGLPLELLLKGDGQSTLETREIDEFGVALVVPKLERLQLKFNETNFNQSGVLGLREGKANISMNGQVIAPNMDWRKVANPDYGLRITKSLRVLGAKSLKTEEELAAEAAKSKANPAAKNPLPFDVASMMQAMIARAIPPLLPDRDVAIGDAWSANIEWPTAPGLPKNADPKTPPGKFDFKALAEEEIAGRKTWRISVDGVLKVDDLSTQLPTADGEKRAANPRVPNFLSLTQKMKGDVWFDAAAGQVVKLDMHLDATMEGREVAGEAADGDMTYNGNLQMDLRKVAFAGNQ